MSTLSLKHINSLAVPAIIAGIAEPIISATDLAIIGNLPHYSAEAASAVGIVAVFLNTLTWILGQSRSAISSILSQYLGANKLQEVHNLPIQAIVIVLGISLFILGITYPFADFIFSLYNAKGRVLDYAIDYYQIRAIGFPMMLVTFAIIGTFRGLQNTFYPMLVALWGLVLNIALDFILVFGIEDVLEPLGLKGAAYASVISQAVMLLIACYYLIKKTPILLRFQMPWNKEIKRLLLMILNLFVRTLALNVALNVAVFCASSYGVNQLNAYTISINIWFICAFFIDGYASAGNMLAGKLLGAKNYKDLIKLSHKLTKYGSIVGVILCIIGFIFYYPLGVLYSNDPNVRSVFYSIFWISILMQPLCGVAFVYDGMFKGMGHMRYLRNVLIIATFF